MALSPVNGTNQGPDRKKQRRGLEVPAEGPWEMQLAHLSSPSLPLPPLRPRRPRARKGAVLPCVRASYPGLLGSLSGTGPGTLVGPLSPKVAAHGGAPRPPAPRRASVGHRSSLPPSSRSGPGGLFGAAGPREALRLGSVQLQASPLSHRPPALPTPAGRWRPPGCHCTHRPLDVFPVLPEAS